MLDFSKASAKVLTIFHSTKSFRKKVEILVHFNTYKDFLKFFLPLHFILYMHTPACMCERAPASALIILYSYSKTEKKSGFN